MTQSKFKKFINPSNYYRVIRRATAKKYIVTYSQFGEDLSLRWLFKILKIEKPTYLDIGANDPRSLNNTFLMYQNGSRGVCIEPDPILVKKIKKVRPHDVVVAAGIGVSAVDYADFYLMDAHRLNTFSKDEAHRMQKMGHVIKNTIRIPLISVNKIIADNFPSHPNLVSLDTEGMDYDILKTFDFTKYKPEVFCIETLTYEKNTAGKKIPEIKMLMENNGYFSFADTYLNTIFINSNAWEKARQNNEQK